MPRAIAALALAAMVFLPASSRADVVDRSATGFTVKATREVAAPPDAVYRAILNVAAWWDSGHTYSGDAKNLSIAAQAGGCFCEKLVTGGAVEHARVVHLVPGALLRMSGALGPLQELGVAGSLTFQIAKSASGSTVTMTYAVGGYAPGGLDALAAPVDAVMGGQMTRLKEHLDRGGR